FGGPLDRFSVTDPRLVNAHVQVVVAEQAVLDHLQVQFAHSANQRLPRLLVFLRAEGRILPLHHFQDVAELLALRGAFRLDRHGDDGFWKDNALQDNWGLRIAERVAGDRVTQADDADDVSRPGA